MDSSLTPEHARRRIAGKLFWPSSGDAPLDTALHPARQGTTSWGWGTGWRATRFRLPCGARPPYLASRPIPFLSHIHLVMTATCPSIRLHLTLCSMHLLNASACLHRPRRHHLLPRFTSRLCTGGGPVVPGSWRGCGGSGGAVAAARGGAVRVLVCRTGWWCQREQSSTVRSRVRFLLLGDHVALYRCSVQTRGAAVHPWCKRL